MLMIPMLCPKKLSWTALAATSVREHTGALWTGSAMSLRILALIATRMALSACPSLIWDVPMRCLLVAPRGFQQKALGTASMARSGVRGGRIA